MKTILLLGFTCIFALQAKSQITIAAARSAAIGTTVTVTGIVTNGKELGTFIRYMQDGTGGLAAYSSTSSVAGFTNVTLGDSISVTGPTKQFNNLFEIDPIQGFTIHASGKPIPSPMVITPAGFVESTEGQLIEIQNCTFSASGSFAANTNYTVTSASATFVMRVVSSATTIVGAPIPTGAVNIVGLSSQYCFSPATGCTTGYQLLPRTINDITTFSGINELNSTNVISVYPNPVNTTLNLELKNETIKDLIISDNLGRIVLSSKENSSKVDVSYLDNGIYHILVTTNKSNYRSKFIVEK